MDSFFQFLVEFATGGRIFRYLIGGGIIVGTLWLGDFSTVLPWIILIGMAVCLVVFELIQRDLENAPAPPDRGHEDRRHRHD